MTENADASQPPPPAQPGTSEKIHVGAMGPANLDAGDVVVDIQDSTFTNIVRSPTFDSDEYRARGAQWVAQGLVIIFGGTLLLGLAAALLVFWAADGVEQAERLGVVLGTVLTSLSDFAAKVFLPLLAFVLGYYFSEAKRGGSGAS